MTSLTAERSPQTYARVGGVLYLIIIVGGALGEAVVRNGLIVWGDATATAGNIMNSEFLWRVGVASEFFMLVCTVVLTLILYVLLRPVSRDLALLAVFFNLMAVAVEAANEMNLLAALIPLKNADALKVFDTQQLNALAYAPIKSYGLGFGNSLIFFGSECLLLGYLIFRSGYLPRAIGVLMVITGLCYLINSFSLILSPTVASLIFPAIMLPVLVGEGSLCLWLLLKGVNLEKWPAGAMHDPGLLSGA